jgi:hypothetical protein
VVEDMDNDINACLSAFGNLCKEADYHELVNEDNYQYWIFERGYQAAMQEVAKVVKLRQSDRDVDLNLQRSTNRAALPINL